MKLNEAQQKLSSDIAQLHETYELISKNKTRFTDLDVALLQQQLLFIYHSLLRLQSQIHASAESITETVVANEVVYQIHTQTAPDTLFTEASTPQEVEIPVVDEVEQTEVYEGVASLHEELPVTTPINLFADINTSVSKLNNITENEPTIEDLEVMAKQEEDSAAIVNETPVEVVDDIKVEVKEEVKEEIQPIALSSLQLTIPVATPIETTERSLLDKLSATVKAPDVYERIAKEQQQSLKQAINLNKKIAFVNNLFNENTVEYAKAIEKLNTSSSLHESLRYFNELKHQYNWNNENALVKDLEQLIEKRFA